MINYFSTLNNEFTEDSYIKKVWLLYQDYKREIFFLYTKNSNQKFYCYLRKNDDKVNHVDTLFLL